MGVFDNYKQYNDAEQNLDSDGIDIVRCEHKDCFFNCEGTCVFETCMFTHPYMPLTHRDLTKACPLCGEKYPTETTKEGFTFISKNPFCPDCMDKIRTLLNIKTNKGDEQNE